MEKMAQDVDLENKASCWALELAKTAFDESLGVLADFPQQFKTLLLSVL